MQSKNGMRSYNTREEQFFKSSNDMTYLHGKKTQEKHLQNHYNFKRSH